MAAHDTETAGDDLEALVTLVASHVEHDSWIDVVIDLVDDVAHAGAADAYNTSEGSGDDDADHEALHAAADARRAALFNAAPSEVAAFLAAEIGAAAAVAELTARAAR